jgi:hypothetical protein
MINPLKTKSLLGSGAAIMVLGVGIPLFGLTLGTQAQQDVEVIEEEGAVEETTPQGEVEVEEEGVEVIEEQTTPQAPSDQDRALKAVATMTEGQRTYYQKNNQFQDNVDNLKKDFGITIPSSYDAAIRTTDEAAYNYLIPNSSSSQLKAYVGATFLAPDGSGELTTIICENNDPGEERPSDPELVRGTGVNEPTTEITLQCGEYSTQVPASKVTER